MRLLLYGPLLALAMLAPAPVFAQESEMAPTRADPDDPPNPDIIVRGFRERKKLGLIGTGSLRNSVLQSRQHFERSRRLANCAARGRLAPPARLRAVADAVVGSAAQIFAQDRLKRTYITCSAEGGALLSIRTAEGADNTNALVRATASSSGNLSFAGAPANSDPAPLGHSRYDRGAIMVAALERFAPDLVLTRQQTHDPEVQRRFNAREIPLNRFRRGGDRLFFEVAVCLVRIEPQLALRVALNDDRTLASDLPGALIDVGRDCVGGARRVAVDPTELRMYVADAVYRWAVASRGVDTLIPDSNSR